VLLLGGAIGAATVGDSQSPRHLAASRSNTTTSTTSAGPAASSTTSSTAAGAKTGATSGSSSAAAGGGSGTAANLGAPGDPGQPAVTKAGTYRYHVSIKSSEGNDEEDTDYRVEDLARGPDGPRQLHTLRTQQGAQTSEMSWRAAGVYIDRQAFNFGGGTTDCDWDPDILALVEPMAVGKTWTAKSHCSTTAHTQIGDVPLDLDITLTGKVTGTERVLVGGEPVDVWVIAGTINIHGTSSGSEVLTEKGTYTTKLAPKVGLETLRYDDLDITSPQGSGHATSDRQLLSLHAA
jgi:hypothetical protein